MERVIRFKAVDGTEFTSEEECLAHESREQHKHAFVDWYDMEEEEGPTIGIFGVCGVDMAVWLLDNRAQVLALLGVDEEN